MNTMRRFVEPVIRRVLHLYWRQSRGLTLGVRAVVIDDQSRVFLIKHSYVTGWHLPGGGAERGEPLLDALVREVREEENMELIGAPELRGMYFNRRVSQRDHVALYVVRDFRQPSPPKPNHEIIAHGFFALDALPNDTTAGTRAPRAEGLLRAAPTQEREP